VAEESLRRIEQEPVAYGRTLGSKSIFVTAKGVADKLAIAFTTAQRAIERLERAHIVKRVGDAKRDRVYCATALLEVLEEPAGLKPGGNK